MMLSERPKRKVVDWSLHDETLIRMRRDEHASAATIAEAIGCSRSAVEDRICALRHRGVDLPSQRGFKAKWSGARVKRLLGMFRRGLDDGTIAHLLHTTRGAVSFQRHQYRMGLVVEGVAGECPEIPEWVKRRAAVGSLPLPAGHPIALEVLGMTV